MARLVPVILCGGSGTRLWPRSRADRPKPFIPLTGGETLFAATLARCADPAMFREPMIVTGAAHLDHVVAEPGGRGIRIIVEPAQRNTAAAIALAAHRLDPDDVMLVCPSDHHIADPAAFSAAAACAGDLAAQGWLVAFGIAPDAPETGFGYIRQGKTIGDDAFAVDRFVEKPDRARAEQFLREGGYSWNGGLFAFRAGTFLEELATHRPAMAEAVRVAVAQGREDGLRFHPDADAFAAIAAESVDYAVMENTARAAMVPVAMGWSDIGNWQALHAALPKDAQGNVTRGRVDLANSRNVMVDSDGPRVSVIGLDGVVVIVDGDEVLVTSMDGAQEVGKLAGAKDQ